MSGNHAPHPPQLPPSSHMQDTEPGVLLGHDAIDHVQQIADERQAAAAAKIAELMDDPKIATMIETGQLTTADALAREVATGTSEPPKPRGPRPKRINTRGGRSYPEAGGRDRGLQLTEATTAPLAPDEEHAYLDSGAPMTKEEALEYAAKATRKRMLNKFHKDERVASLRNETTHPGARWRAQERN